jgi:hypothetical protein
MAREFFPLRDFFKMRPDASPGSVAAFRMFKTIFLEKVHKNSLAYLAQKKNSWDFWDNWGWLT